MLNHPLINGRSQWHFFDYLRLPTRWPDKHICGCLGCHRFAAIYTFHQRTSAPSPAIPRASRAIYLQQQLPPLTQANATTSISQKKMTSPPIFNYNSFGPLFHPQLGCCFGATSGKSWAGKSCKQTQNVGHSCEHHKFWIHLSVVAAAPTTRLDNSGTSCGTIALIWAAHKELLALYTLKRVT